MSTFFVDTSALGRRYLPEIGSSWVLTWVEPQAGNLIVVSELATIEMFATFARLQRQGTLITKLNVLQNDYLLHLANEYFVVLLNVRVLTGARDLVTKHPLRTLDAIQLACAIEARSTLGVPVTFISGDNRLLTAATVEGFTIDNPYAHP